MNLKTIVIHLLSAAAVLAGSATYAQTGAVTIHDAWARQPMGGHNITGAFATVQNASDKPLAIVAASSDISDNVELHDMRHEGGMMQMSPVPKIVVPARGKVELKPGSLHVMLFNLKRKVADGDRFTLTLTLDDGTTVTTDATFRKSVPQR